MLLKCIDTGHLKFKIGNKYDIAEIAEMPGHAMARKQNGKWPKPGEKYFGFHPEQYFECPQNGLEILSCGYSDFEEEFYGVIIPMSKYKNKINLHRRIATIIDKYDEDYPIWWVHWNNILTSASHPKLERNMITIGFEHRDLGRDLSYDKAKRSIRKILKELGLSHLSENINDVYMSFWIKDRWTNTDGKRFW